MENLKNLLIEKSKANLKNYKPKNEEKITTFAESEELRKLDCKEKNNSISEMENNRLKELKKRDKYPLRPHNVLLAMAFNIAQQTWDNVYKNKNEKGITESNKMAINYLLGKQKKEYLGQEQVDYDKNYNELLNNLPIINAVFDKIRNYYSHVFHEPSPIFFKDELGINTIEKNNYINSEKWTIARNFFQNLFDMNKNKYMNKLNTKHEKENIKTEEKERLQKVIQKIKYIELFKENLLTSEGALFIACIFMKKSDANFIVQKWTGIKKSEDVFKEVQNFFKEYSVRDAESITSDLRPLIEFRNILSYLRAIPYNDNPQLELIYQWIYNYNKKVQDKITEKEIERFNLTFKEKKGKKDDDIIHINQEIEYLRKKILPIRKSKKTIDWLMLFLEQKGQFKNDWKIACYKNEDDAKEKEEYFETELKNSQNNTPEQKKIQKELNQYKKRNFVFRKPEPNNITKNYYETMNNAILEIPINNTPVIVQVSEEVLIKWAAIILINENNVVKDNNINQYIESYIKEFIKTISSDVSEINKDSNNLLINFGVKLRDAIPESILKNISSEDYEADWKNKLSNSLVIEKIKDRLKEITDFVEENKNIEFPWKHNSRDKINYIINYINFCNYQKGIEEGLIENVDLAKKGLALYEHKTAYQYIRFFGREKETDSFKKFFENDKFKDLQPLIEKSARLENLFSNSMSEYIHKLNKMTEIAEKANKDTIFKLATLFNVKIEGVKKPSIKTDVQNQIKHSWVKNLSLPYSLLDKFILNGKPENNLLKVIISKLKSEHTGNKDFIIKHILTKPEVNDKIIFRISKKHENVKFLPVVVHKKLTEIELEETILWQIAKSFWSNSNSQNTNFNPNDFKCNVIYEKGYFEATSINSFNKVLDKFVDIKLLKEKEGIKLNTEYFLRISARKIDDEFLYYERDYIFDYLINKFQLTFEKIDKKGVKKVTTALIKENIIDYENIRKFIQKELGCNLNIAYLILRLEREFIDKNINDVNFLNKALNRLHKEKNKEGNDVYTEFYIDYEHILDKLLPPTELCFKEKHKTLRNKAVHRNLIPKNLKPCICTLKDKHKEFFKWELKD